MGPRERAKTLRIWNDFWCRRHHKFGSELALTMTPAVRLPHCLRRRVEGRQEREVRAGERAGEGGRDRRGR
jgi:hypothetical protein